MLKLLQYCNYIIVVMQIKLMLLFLLLTVNMMNCLTPKNPKMSDPILVTLLKIRPREVTA